MQKTIEKRTTVNFWLTIVGWLALLALPLFLINYSFTSFLQESYFQSSELVRPELNNELYRFKRDLSYDTWLEERLKEFNRKNGFFTRQEAERHKTVEQMSALNANKLKERLESFLGFPVACLFYYGPDTHKVSQSIGKNKSFDLNSVPRILLQRMLGTFNDQQKSAILQNASCKRKLSSLIERSGKEGVLKNAQFLLSTVFGNISFLQLKDFQLTETIATKLGDHGPVLFYLAPTRIRLDNKLANAGGYLAVFRVQDIPTRPFVEAALAKKSALGIKRNIVVASQAIEAPEPYDTALGKQISDESGEYLRSLIPQRLLIKLLQKGTIRIEGIDAFLQKPLLLEVSIGRKFLEHWLAGYKKLIRFFLLIIFTCVSAGFVYLYLFGLDFKISVSVKILSMVLLSSLLPVSLLLMSYAAEAEFSQNSSRQQISQYLSLRQSALHNLVIGRLIEYERQNLELGMQLENAKSNEELILIVKKWLKKSLAAGAYLQKYHEVSQGFEGNKRLNIKRNLSVEKSIEQIMAQAYMEYLYQSPLMGVGVGGFSSSITDSMTNADTFHEFLSRSGNFISLPRISRDFYFSPLAVFSKNRLGISAPSILVLLKFPINLLTRNVFSELKNELALSEVWGNYRIDLAVCLRTTDGLRLLNDFKSPKLAEQEIMPYIRQCNSLQRDVEVDTIAQGKKALIVANYESILPYIVLLRAEKLEQEYSVSYAGIIAYLTLLLLSIILLSQLFFIDPIHKLSSGLSRISQGRLTTKISLESGDEFEKLGSAINVMTQELIQKEKLAEFVSDEVLKLVSDEDSMVMKPGGELLEATMMFCEPCGFADWAMHCSPAETVLMLNNFIAEVAEVCSEFYGSIDKLDDATIMVVFRSHPEAASNEQRACRAALRLSQKLDKEHAKFPFKVKSGISSGMVVSGKIGSNTGKLDFTVIGDAVNTAARLKSIAEGLGTKSRILVSQTMAEKISAVAELRAITDVTIKGKSGKHKVFELLNIT